MKSMTGYGSSRGEVDRGMFNIDIRALNHRFCEIIVRLPQTVAQFEPLIRQTVSNWFSRGRIEITITEILSPSSARKFILDETLIDEHKKLINKLSNRFGIKKEMLFASVDPTKYIVPVNVNSAPKSWWGKLKPILDRSCRQVDAMRVKEGRRLFKDQRDRLKSISSIVDKLLARSKHALNFKISTLKERIAKSGLDTNQFAQEEISLINRYDTTEEITRLKSHLSQYKKLLGKDVVGRRLDFLLQEMTRETTTFGSKIGDGVAAQLVVDCKAEIERLREQAQNIE